LRHVASGQNIVYRDELFPASPELVAPTLQSSISLGHLKRKAPAPLHRGLPFVPNVTSFHSLAHHFWAEIGLLLVCGIFLWDAPRLVGYLLCPVAGKPPPTSYSFAPPILLFCSTAYLTPILWRVHVTVLYPLRSS